MHLGGVSLTFMQEKRGRHINLCTPIEYPKEWVRGWEGQHKIGFTKAGSEEFEHSLPSFASALPCTSKQLLVHDHDL